MSAIMLLFMLVVPFAADSKQYIDLAGAEALYPTRDYREIFLRAKGYGIPFTIHAGEADGADSVKEEIKSSLSR